MSNVGPEYRSYLPIARADLRRLAEIARRDREAYFVAHSYWAELYADRLLCTALCQGAALHYLNGETGINDLDIFSFFRRHPDRDWYPRRRVVYDFGDPKFGQSADKPRFVGRRVDCMGRSIDAVLGEEPVTAVRRYLRAGRTTTARLLAQKAVILLEPACGVVVWPVNTDG
jgi:hypothetical protein